MKGRRRRRDRKGEVGRASFESLSGESEVKGRRGRNCSDGSARNRDYCDVEDVVEESVVVGCCCFEVGSLEMATGVGVSSEADRPAKN